MLRAIRRSFGSRPASAGDGVRAGARAPAAHAEQLRRPAVRRRAVGRERQARPLRLHHEDARPRRRGRRDAQSARRDRGDPGSKDMDPRQSGDSEPDRARPRRRGAQLPRGLAAARPRRDADRRAFDPGVSRDDRRRDAGARARCGRRLRVPAAAAAQHALHPRHDLLDLWRRHAEPALLAGAARGDDPHHLDLQVPSPTSRARSTSGGAIRPRTGALPHSRAATSCRSASATCLSE